MKNLKTHLLILAAMVIALVAPAQRQMEILGRGVVAVRTGSSSVYVGWRLLGTDPDDTRFNLYRVTGGVTNLLVAGITNSCNFVDNGAAQASAHSWFVQPILNGVTQANSASFSIPAGAPTQQYLNLPLTPPPDGVAYDGVAYTYNANDCSAGDVDGDGEYEIILKWDPSNAKDNSQSGFTGNTFLDCYKLDGTRLWRIDLGPNVRSGAHYTQFMVYDFDGDGKAELMCRTAPGSKDGPGSYVGGGAKWQNANGARPAFNSTDDYRFNNPNNTTNGYVLYGPEFLTVFNGLTGEEMATATYWPKRDQDNNDDNPSASRINTVWGDSYGNRLDRFLAGIAFVDGVRPSAIFCRGYYTRAYLAAWDWRNGTLTRRWTFSSDPSNLAYRGQGAHSLSIGDADGDGKDEILYGAASIDDNGQGHYSTGLGHGDAEHFSDMDPLRPGLEVWMVHESPSSYGPAGLEFRDAKTGGLIFGVDGQNADVGRGVAYDIDPRYRGYEMWGSRGGLMSATGVQITSSRPGQMNFCAWWDADTLRESLDGTTIYEWNWTSSANNSIFSPGGLSSNNGTKSNPGLSADLFGDWREEVIWRTSDNLNLRIYTTTTVATNRLYTLMHDPQYRCAIAWQNTGYNQPPHPGFFIGQDMFPPPVPPFSTADLVWRGGALNTWDENATPAWGTNGIWSNNTASVVFSAGKSVLFDISASNTAVALNGMISPGQVTVHSPKDYSFTGGGQLGGSMKLIKAGPARLTISNTNNYTGATHVRGGALFVNGTLTGSPVIVERRGSPEGPSQIGGSGRLGNGLTVQAGCSLTVGANTNSPGTLTVANSMAELGAVLNRFDLSDDPTGVTKTNDRIAILGNLVLSGTNTIEISQLDGALGGGVYPLFNYSGTLTGGLTNLALSGAFIQPVALTNPPGVIGLLAVVPAAPPNAPGGLAATAIGAFQINLAWTDNSADENAFLIERSQGSTANFAQIASVAPNSTTYQDIGLSANTTYYYRVRGTNLAGFSGWSNTNSATTTATPPSLTWKGDGTANVWDVATTANWLNGASQTLYADGAFVTFSDSGSNSPLIALVGPLAPGTLTVNASKAYTFGGTGLLSGATSLVKAGSGSLSINITNTFTGGVILSNGTVIPGNTGANSAGLGYGPITFRGGTLEFTGWTGSSSPDYGGNINAYIIPAGAAGTIRVPQRFLSPGLVGPLTGSGTLNLQVKYVRGDVNGNWAGFTGTINVTRGNSGATVDDFRVANANGFPNARLHLGTNVLMYSRAAASSVIPIGQFSGVSGATVTAGGCSGNCGAGTQNAVTWRVGGLNTDATNAALFAGTTSLIKEGTGKWTLTQDNTYTGTTVVNGGTLVVNGNQSAATGNVTVNGSGKLGGTGVIGGNITIIGTLAPGTSIGTLTFNGDLSFNSSGTALFEISRNPFGNDQAVVAGAATFGGALQVLNTSIEALQAGDNFQLFSAASYNGSFATFDLPLLETGLAWNTSRLGVDGRLWVVATNPPTINVQQSGDFLIFTGQGGTPGWNYDVLSATDPRLPLDQWTVAGSDVFDGAGGFAFAVPIDVNVPQKFFRLRVQ